MTLPLTDELMAQIKAEARRELEAEKLQDRKAGGATAS